MSGSAELVMGNVCVERRGPKLIRAMGDFAGAFGLATALVPAFFLVTIALAGLVQALRADADFPDCRAFNASSDQWVIPLCRFQSCLSQSDSDIASCGNEPTRISVGSSASAHWNFGNPGTAYSRTR